MSVVFCAGRSVNFTWYFCSAFSRLQRTVASAGWPKQQDDAAILAWAIVLDTVEAGSGLDDVVIEVSFPDQGPNRDLVNAKLDFR